MNKPIKFNGRGVIKKETFQVSGTFESMYAAERWLTENGYDCGSGSACNMPTALMKGDYYSHDLPHKWKNFSPADKKRVHGVMTGDMRDGPVTVYIFE